MARISGAGQMQLAVISTLTRTRIKSGKSQDEIADRVGVTRQAIAAWEGGVTLPSATNLFLWAAALNLKITVGTNESAQP